MKNNKERNPKEFFESDDMFNDFDISQLHSEPVSREEKTYTNSELDIFPTDSDNMKVTLPPHKQKETKATSILNALSIFSIIVITGMFLYFMTSFGKFYEWKNSQSDSAPKPSILETQNYDESKLSRNKGIYDGQNNSLNETTINTEDSDLSTPSSTTNDTPFDNSSVIDDNDPNETSSDGHIDSDEDSIAMEVSNFMETNSLSKYLNSDYERFDNGFYYSSISTKLMERMNNVSFHENTNISYEDLCYLLVQYYDFDNNVQTGELVCNKKIANDLLDIFNKLYQNKYQIGKIKLVDDYFADDDMSCADNNTSCFNYREVAGSTNLSKHAYGLAIDINPFYNPYVTYPDGVEHISPIGSEVYADRTFVNPHMIKEGDLCYNLFIEHGFTWGGNWKTLKDYQHFQKGQ